MDDHLNLSDLGVYSTKRGFHNCRAVENMREPKENKILKGGIFSEENQQDFIEGCKFNLC